MAQHDQVIDNGPGLAVRTDFNAALAALFSSSSGAVEPAVKVAGQLWFNTTTGKLQVRNSGNTAWQSLTGELAGTVSITSPVTFSGASAGATTPLIEVRDSVTTTGATGNAVLAINKQNSATEALIFGNDGNGAALIGGNNVPLRFGKWVSGVFTEYMNMSAAGVFTFASGTQSVIVSAVSGSPGLEISGGSPNIKLTDTTASAYDFWMHADAQNWYVLVDRTASGTWDTPHPLMIEADTNKGFLFGSEMLTVANADTLGVVPEARTVTAGNGLTGGGALSANITLTMGTPGSLSNSTTNAVTATSHTHALGFTASEVYEGTAATNTTFPIGHTVLVNNFVSSILNNAAVVVRLHSSEADNAYEASGSGTALAGTWRARGRSGGIGLAQRVA